MRSSMEPMGQWTKSGRRGRATGNDHRPRRRYTWPLALVPLFAMVLALGLGGGTAHASPAACGTNGTMTTSGELVTCTYTTAGADTFNVPQGVNSLTVEAVGAGGGSGYNGQSSPPVNGGLGGDVNATVSVTGGSTVQVSVGALGENAATTCTNVPGAGGAGIGAGGSAGASFANGGRGGTEAGGGGAGGGCAGGGGGGGASSLYVAPSTWLVVAGGGGGGGDSGVAGGNADAANTADGGSGATAYGFSAGGGGGTAAGVGGGHDPQVDADCYPAASCDADGGNAAGSTPNGYSANPGSGAGGQTLGGGGGGGGYAGGGAGWLGSAGGAGSSYGPAGATFAPASVAAEVVITYNIADDDLALSGVPADKTVDATSPQGATVTYTAPSASDEDGDNPAATVSCDPASGSTIAIGTTTVTCTATDSDDSNSPVSATFNVTVKGAADQASDLLGTVDGLHLGQQQASYDTQMQAVQTDISTNNGLACSDLTAFINHVKAQSGKQLTTAQASQLIAAATQIQAVLGC